MGDAESKMRKLLGQDKVSLIKQKQKTCG